MITYFVVQSCQLNAYFVDAELELGSHLAKAMGDAPNGTFIEAFAFQYGAQSMMAAVDRQCKMICTSHYMLKLCPPVLERHATVPGSCCSAQLGLLMAVCSPARLSAFLCPSI